ncbi:hypothetical protein AB1Y20_016155 [Prymnesium parvum]|uniref:Potassium channel domain-containing protein n=1 Tax=Prymnesium parvum TaxID=97485 RepID=A0AB34JZZ8_PRYPA
MGAQSTRWSFHSLRSLHSLRKLTHGRAEVRSNRNGDADDKKLGDESDRAPRCLDGYRMRLFCHAAFSVANCMTVYCLGGFTWFPASVICFGHALVSFSTPSTIIIAALHHLFLGITVLTGQADFLDVQGLLGDPHLASILNASSALSSDDARYSRIYGTGAQQYKECTSASLAQSEGGFTIEQLKASINGDSLGEPTWVCTWSFVDTLYFVVATLSTVGYGDLLVRGEIARQFLMVYAMTGMVVFASFSIASRQGFYHLSMVLLSRFHVERKDSRPVPSHVKLYAHVVALVAIFFALHITSACVFIHLEGWDFTVAFYHCIVTAATIGYGDIPIKTEAGRIFAVAHMLLSTIFFTGLLGLVGHHVELAIEERREDELLKHVVDEKVFRQLKGDSLHLRKYEYVLGILQLSGHADPVLISALETRFREIDMNGDGVLNVHDLLHPQALKRIGSVHHHHESKYTSVLAFRLAFFSFAGIPVFFVMNIFGYVWSIANCAQCVLALCVVFSNRMSRTIFVLGYVAIALQVLALAVGIWLVSDLKTLWDSIGFAKFSSFGFHGLREPEHLASLTAHLYIEGLPRFRDVAQGSLSLCLIWIFASVFMLVYFLSVVRNQMIFERAREAALSQGHSSFGSAGGVISLTRQ